MLLPVRHFSRSNTPLFVRRSYAAKPSLERAVDMVLDKWRAVEPSLVTKLARDKHAPLLKHSKTLLESVCGDASYVGELAHAVGLTLQHDVEQAVYWLELAHQEGYEESIFSLGVAHFEREVRQ